MKQSSLRYATGECEPIEESGARTDLTVCLITALTVVDFIDPELSVKAHSNRGANLGVLTLTAILRERGFQVSVLNLDDQFIAFMKQAGARPKTDAKEEVIARSPVNGGYIEGPVPSLSNHFFPFVADQLRNFPCDVFGFSSICSSYALTLRLAREVKLVNPEATIVLGGPQASVVDAATMRAFEYVDYVVRGEADESFPALLHLLSNGSAASYASIPGITFRSGDDVIRNQNGPVISDLDSLPLPAFDLDPDIRTRGGVHLEVGRGCPFSCTFCSTNDFFRRNFRLKSSKKMVKEMQFISKEYGLTYFSLVHDMYTVDRKRVVEFCETLLETNEKLTWGCSARTDCIDDELLELMARAGCRGIFFGIETGSKRLQHVINKNLNLTHAMERIRCADKHGIKTAVALIIGFPEETRDDLRDTVHFFIDSLRFDNAEPQLSLLAPLAATPVYERHKDELVFDDIVSSMSYQGWRQDPAELEMIKSYPEIFPNFYAVPTTCVDRRYLKELMDFLLYIASRFRWLPVALLQDCGDFLALFDKWRAWLADRGPAKSESETDWAPYYSQGRFRVMFLDFVRTCYIGEMATERAAIAALTQTEGVRLVNRPKQQTTADTADDLNADSLPYRTDNLAILDLGIDYKELIQCLRNKTNLSRVAQRRTTVAFTPTGEKRPGVLQMAPLSASLLSLCDGKRTVSEIVRKFSDERTGDDGIPVEVECLFGLLQLQKDGLVRFSSGAVASEKEQQSAQSNDAAADPFYTVPPQAKNTQQPWPSGEVG